MLDLQEQSARYDGRLVLDNITMKVQAGEKVALMGKSGSGKSTLIKLLYERYRADCSLVPQEFSLVRPLSVFHNVYIGKLHRHATVYNLLNLLWPQSKEIARIKPILARFNMADTLRTPVGELSGGQQQRVAVARAVFNAKPILLGDEPVSALDNTQSQRVMETLCECFETTLLAMHDVALALKYADRILGIKDSALVLDESSDRLKAADLDFLYH